MVKGKFIIAPGALPRLLSEVLVIELVLSMRHAFSGIPESVKKTFFLFFYAQIIFFTYFEIQYIVFRMGEIGAGEAVTLSAWEEKVHYQFHMLCITEQILKQEIVACRGARCTSAGRAKNSGR